MILYHGTVKESFDLILSHKIVSVASETNSPYAEIGDLHTIYGYVYFTSDFYNALNFGNLCFHQRYNSPNSPRIIYIIKTEIPDELLIDDEAELSGNCYKYADSIPVEKCQYCEMTFDSWNQCCKYIDEKNNSKPIDWKYFE